MLLVEVVIVRQSAKIAHICPDLSSCLPSNLLLRVCVNACVLQAYAQTSWITSMAGNDQPQTNQADN